jgi:hypothetical protein
MPGAVAGAPQLETGAAGSSLEGTTGMTETPRSLARIDRSGLLRLAALAAEAEARLFARHPHGAGRYAGRCARGRPCITWTAGTASRTSTSGRSTRPSATAHSPTGGGARPTSALPSSAAGPVTRRRTPGGVSTSSGGRCPRRSVPTRRPSCVTTCQRRAPRRPRHWRPRQSSWSPRNIPPASASGPSRRDTPPELGGTPVSVSDLGNGPENRRSARPPGA